MGTRVLCFVVLLGVVGVACRGPDPQSCLCPAESAALEPADGSGPGGAILTVASWNLHGTPNACAREERFDRGARRILEEALRPDLVLLQEVWMWNDAKRLTAFFAAAGYDALSNSNGCLLRHGGLLAFRRRDAAWRLMDGDVASFEEYGSRPPRCPLVEPGWSDAFSHKGYEAFRLEHRPSGLRVQVLHTHLQAQYEANQYPLVRGAQIERLGQVVNAHAAEPVLVFGDLNTRPKGVDVALYEKMRDLFGDDLTERKRRTSGCWTSWGEPWEGRCQWIDYGFARAVPGVTIAARVGLLANRAEGEVSDHEGLVFVIDVAR